jgi:hypothetical protein
MTKLVSLVGVALVAFGLGTLFQNGDAQDDAGSTGANVTAAQAGQEPAPAPTPVSERPPAGSRGVIGQAIRDGVFEFTIRGLECGASTVGNEYLNEQAQGQFCKLHVRVQNIGDRAGTLFPDNQYLLAADGTQHSASSSATYWNDPQGQSLVAQINPGNAVEGTFVFDVPPGAQIAAAELHDSAFSGGVEVRLQ